LPEDNQFSTTASPDGQRDAVDEDSVNAGSLAVIKGRTRANCWSLMLLAGRQFETPGHSRSIRFTFSYAILFTRDDDNRFLFAAARSK
jgi:hypothetical protein